MDDLWIVMPAYNAEQTLAATVADIPAPFRQRVLLVDDGSRDRTVAEGLALGLEVVSHPRNRGYGAAQKTGYREVLHRGAALVVLLHSDFQYDAATLPSLVTPILDGQADAVLGSRLLEGDPRSLGMAWWRYRGNRLLTVVENRTLKLALTDYHSGLRAYSRTYLRAVRFHRNADGFLFDQQIMVQGVAAGLRIAEIPARCRYTHVTSSISFPRSVAYGVGTLRVMAAYRRFVRDGRPAGTWLSPARRPDAPDLRPGEST